MSGQVLQARLLEAKDELLEAEMNNRQEDVKRLKTKYNRLEMIISDKGAQKPKAEMKRTRSM